MGASSGIGLALAEAFASRGVSVGVAARRVEGLKELQKKYPERVVCEGIDVTHRNAPQLLDSLIKKLGGMDIYIHVAGIGYSNPELEPDREMEIVGTDALGFARMVSNAYNWFRSNGRRGRIAAVTSIAGTRGIGEMAAYSASKCFCSCYIDALDQLSRIQNVDISFTDIRPGWIRTPLVNPDRHYPFEMNLEIAVPEIIRAIVRRRRVAVIGIPWKVIVPLWRMLPRALWVRIGALKELRPLIVP